MCPTGALTIKENIRDLLIAFKEGKHVGTSAPYGYDKYKLPKQKGYTLKINDYEAKMIKLIYNLYCKAIEALLNFQQGFFAWFSALSGPCHSRRIVVV